MQGVVESAARQPATAAFQISPWSFSDCAISAVGELAARDLPVPGQPRVEVSAEEIADRRPRAFRQQVDPEPGRADGIGLLGDELSPRIEAGGRSRERERDDEAEQGEDRPVDGPRAASLAAPLHQPPPEVAADFQHRQRSEEQAGRDDEDD